MLKFSGSMDITIVKTAYDAANNIDAHLVMHQLQQAGIDARIEGEFLQGGIGELPAAGNVRVIVDDQDLAEARAVIADWEAGDSRPEPVKGSSILLQS